MSSIREILNEMGHAALTLAQDPRCEIADRSPQNWRDETHFMALKGDLLNEVAAKLDALFCKAAETTLSGDFIDAPHHLDGSEVGIIASVVDDYIVGPIHAAIGEWEANEAAGWNDRSGDEEYEWRRA